MTPYKENDAVLVTLRTHTFIKRKSQAVEKDPFELPGRFIRYHDDFTRAYVEIHTKAEGKRVQSFPLSRIKGMG